MSMAAHLDTLLGLGRDAGALTFLQISLRGVVVFVAALVIVRCGDRRFLSQKTAFDAVLGSFLRQCSLAPSTAPRRSFPHLAADWCSSSSIGYWRIGRAVRMPLVC